MSTKGDKIAMLGEDSIGQCGNFYQSKIHFMTLTKNRLIKDSDNNGNPPFLFNLKHATKKKARKNGAKKLARKNWREKNGAKKRREIRKKRFKVFR